jgi:hypothetical protein
MASFQEGTTRSQADGHDDSGTSPGAFDARRCTSETMRCNCAVIVFPQTF